MMGWLTLLNLVYIIHIKVQKYGKDFFLRIFGIKIFKQDILKKTSMHYTLYKGESNIIDNTCYLEILILIQNYCQ